ncbi:MAG: ATP-dependent RecD-like DNA helicase [Prevotella sp.]
MHNEEMNLAWQYLEGTQTSVFLTGKAGTGKTTFLRKLRELSPKRMVVLAPTGVAAINAGGQTIHSFFQLPLTPFIPGVRTDNKQKFFRMSNEKKNLIRTLDLLVIDEVSMVRSDLLDAIDDALRRYRNPLKPFGGTQLLLIGDLQQLPPVIKDNEWAYMSQWYDTPYFFSSNALKQLPYVTIELTHIYRQQDTKFISILAAIRDNRVSCEMLGELNKRCVPEPPAMDNSEWIRLTTHNAAANSYNELRLSMIDKSPFTNKAIIKGTFPEYSYPTDLSLTLKVGAQVMFVRNDMSPEKRYYNGRIGQVVNISADGVSVKCIMDDGTGTDTIIVKPEQWDNIKYSIDDETKEIVEEVEGTFTQYPLRLAWAITIHKSQGLTFSHAVLDISHSFAHGQVYVALSRCRTLEGLILSSPVTERSIITDRDVSLFMESAVKDTETHKKSLPLLRYQYFYSLLDEQFTFRQITNDYDHLMRVSYEAFTNTQLTFIDMLRAKRQLLQTEVLDVARRFKTQYDSIIREAGGDFAKDVRLRQRTTSAAIYFADKLEVIVKQILDTSDIVARTIGNKATKKKMNNAIEALRTSYRIKMKTLRATSAEGFSVKQYLASKAQATISDAPSVTTLSRIRKKKL